MKNININKENIVPLIHLNDNPTDIRFQKCKFETEILIIVYLC